MTEIIKTSTAIITKQITEAGETELITNHGFMITDLIIDSRVQAKLLSWSKIKSTLIFWQS